MICPNCAGNNPPRSQKCEWCGQWFDPPTPKTTLINAEIYWMNSDNTADGMRWDAWTDVSDAGFQPYIEPGIEPGDFVTIVDGEYQKYENSIPTIGVGNFDSPISWMTKTLAIQEVEN